MMKKNTYEETYTDIHELYEAVIMFIDAAKTLKAERENEVVAYYDISSEYGDTNIKLTTFVEIHD